MKPVDLIKALVVMIIFLAIGGFAGYFVGFMTR